MTVQCGWCRITFDNGKPDVPMDPPGLMSHGLCAGCANALRMEAGLPATLPLTEPVVYVDHGRPGGDHTGIIIGSRNPDTGEVRVERMETLPPGATEADIRAAIMREAPPLIAGGQGRTDAQVEANADALLGWRTVVAALAVSALAVAIVYALDYYGLV